MSNKLNMGLEAQFHRQIKSLPWCSRRMQGEVMGAFRAVVPDDARADTTTAELAKAKKEAADLSVLLQAAMKDVSALRGQLDVAITNGYDAHEKLVRAQQAAKQSRSRSLAETLTSTSIGFVGSLCITWGAVAAITSVGTASLVATLGCTLWSITRGYAVRRYFNAKG